VTPAVLKRSSVDLQAMATTYARLAVRQGLAASMKNVIVFVQSAESQTSRWHPVTRRPLQIRAHLPTLAVQDNSRSSPPPNPLSSSYLSPSADVIPEEHFLDNYPPLFDPYRPYYPHSRLLPHLVDVFLAYAGGIFPFLDPEETMSAAVAGTIRPSIANAISAYAARFSDKVPQSPEGRHVSGDSYLEAAKYSLDFEDLGTLKRIHSQILIAWTENGRGKTNNFWEYSRSAALAASELRLGSEDCIRMESSEKTQNDLRMTFWSVVWMELVAGSGVLQKSEKKDVVKR